MPIKKKPKAQNLIRIDSVIYILRISPEQFQAWHNEGRFKIALNRNGKPCITEDDFKKLAYGDFKHQASHAAFLTHSQRQNDDEASGKNVVFDNGIKRNIEKYREYLKIIEQIHSNYSNRIDLTQDETALAAAYALHAKVLNLLNMAFLIIENHYWYASLLLRPIDEAIDLAEYFIIKEDTEVGKKHLKTWFRENKSPSHSTCRKTISEWMATLLGGTTTEIHEESMSDLYGTKSKSVHPTFNEIIIVLYRLKFKNSGTYFTCFDYGPCTNLRELHELSSFFQSSIWSTVQGFLFCFQDKMPLSEKDRSILLAFNNRFENECDQNPF